MRPITADRLSDPYDLVILAIEVHALPAVVVTPEGAIRQSLPAAGLTLGPRVGPLTDPVLRILDDVPVPGVDAALTDDAAAAMWHKWTFITTAATPTCLMRAAVGGIVTAAGRTTFIRDVIHEVESGAICIGHPLPSPRMRRWWIC